MKLFIQEAAEQDVLRQVEWYADKGLPDIARRCYAAALDAINALMAMPEAGLPKTTKKTLALPACALGLSKASMNPGSTIWYGLTC